MKQIVISLAFIFNITILAQTPRDLILEKIWAHDISAYKFIKFMHLATGLDNSVLIEAWGKNYEDKWLLVRENGTEAVELDIIRYDDDSDNEVHDVLEVSNASLVYTSPVEGLVEIRFEGETMIKSSYRLGRIRTFGGYTSHKPNIANPFLALQDGKLTLYRYVPSAERQSSNKEPAAFHVDKTTFAAESGKNYVEFNATVTPNQTYTWSFSDDLKSWTALGELSSENGNLWLRVENKQGQEYIKLK